MNANTMNAVCNRLAIEAQVQAWSLVHGQIEESDCECALLANKIIALRTAQLSADTGAQS